MSMAVEPDSAGVRFPPPFIYLGALLLGLAAERFVTLRSFGIDWRVLVATGALLFVAGAAMMLAAAGLFRRLGTNVPPSQPTTLIATTGPYRWTRNPMYLGMALIYAGLAIGFDEPIAFALLPLVLIAIQTQGQTGRQHSRRAWLVGPGLRRSSIFEDYRPRQHNKV